MRADAGAEGFQFRRVKPASECIAIAARRLCSKRCPGCFRKIFARVKGLSTGRCLGLRRFGLAAGEYLADLRGGAGKLGGSGHALKRQLIAQSASRAIAAQSRSSVLVSQRSASRSAKGSMSKGWFAGPTPRCLSSIMDKN